MSNIVLSRNIISELQKTPEWYHLNQKTIFYHSRWSKPGPNRSKWRFIEDFIKISNFLKKIINKIFFFIVWRCFLVHRKVLEGVPGDSGPKIPNKFFGPKSVLFDQKKPGDRPGTGEKNSKKFEKIFGSTNYRPGRTGPAPAWPGF